MTIVGSVSRGPGWYLREAIQQAEVAAAELSLAQQSAGQGHQVLDGFQAATRDIARDTPYRDVSDSATTLRQKASTATSSAERSGDYDSRAVASLGGAISALNQAIPQLEPADRRAALVAREQLSQADELWWADGALGTALAAINGGAVPYIEAAQADAPGQDVSFTAGEIHGALNESLGYLVEADRIQGQSLQDVHNAVETLRSLSERDSRPIA